MLILFLVIFANNLISDKNTMASFEYSPVAESLKVIFRCKCGVEITTESLDIPLPDFSSDTDDDSNKSEYFECSCIECDREYDITLTSSISGGFGDIYDLDEEDILKVEETFSEEENEYYEKQYLSSLESEYNYYSIYTISINQVKETLEGIQEQKRSVKQLLYRLLYVNVIGSMEAYLSDTFIHAVLSSQEMKRKFTEKFKDFREEKFSLSDLFKIMDKHDRHIYKKLRDIIYHQLPKVSSMYKDILGIDLGNIQEIMKAVVIRHDIVHRNGKDINGNLNEITETDILNLISKTESFIQNIERQLTREASNKSEKL